ncbi:MAG: glycosyl transferase [Bacteroidetes bacterium]|nr:glycosyl transferase [Bacteroidota bacterium]
MKILYAIQGTGNGHVSRALEIVPLLRKKVETDVLISGIQADIKLPFPVQYNLKGMSFIFGQKGGIDYTETWKRNSLIRFMKEVRNFPIEQYDLVINDFEPVSAWAAKRKGVKCISLSHQSAVIHPNAPKPKRTDLIGKLVLHRYAPVDARYGFHFESYDKRIFTPVIRDQIREQVVTENGHYTVYLPAYGDETIIHYLSNFADLKWEVFSKHTKESYNHGNIHIMPVNNEAFVKSLASCEGVFCGAGFETPAEALYMGKKVLVIPMRMQYEQHCNAAALKKLGVPVIKKLNEQSLFTIADWLADKNRIDVDYPDQTSKILDTVLQEQLHRRPATAVPEKSGSTKSIEQILPTGS